jgi:hypothetical protein
MPIGRRPATVVLPIPRMECSACDKLGYALPLLSNDSFDYSAADVGQTIIAAVVAEC